MVNKGNEIFEIEDDEGESDNVRIRDDVNTLDDELLGEDGPLVPMVGMKFKDENAIFEFYKTYAYDIGFPVRKRNSKKDDDGVVKYVTFTCSREGRRSSTASTSLKPQPTIQIGCKARMSTSLETCGVWRINSVILEHNHQISPSKSRLYRRKGAPRKNRIKDALERTSKKAKVASKTTKHNYRSQTASQEGPVIIQPSQQSHYSMLTPLSFSQQLMGVQSTNWSHGYGMSLTPTIGISQPLMPISLPLQCPISEEGAGLVDGSNSERSVTFNL